MRSFQSATACISLSLYVCVCVCWCVQQLHIDMEPLATTPAATMVPPPRSSSSKPQDAGTLTREDFDGGPVSIDEIETGLFLGKHVWHISNRTQQPPQLSLLQAT